VAPQAVVRREQPIPRTVRVEFVVGLH